MKRGILALILGLLLSTLTGCFDLHEEISLNKDGSGSYAMTLDLSEMLDMLASFSEDETEAKDSIRLSMDSVMTEAKEKLEAVRGISKVRTEMQDGKVLLSYAFASIEALNEAQLLQMEDEEDRLSLSESSRYQFARGSFRRRGLPKGFMDEEEDELDESSLQMARMFFGDAKFTTVVHLPGKVKEVNSENALISDRKRTVTQEIPMMDILDEKADLDLEIRFN